MTYAAEQVEAVVAKRHEMIPWRKKQQCRKQEAIKTLSKEIITLKRLGYTLDQIAEALHGEGLDIAALTLKSDLQRTKTKSVRKAPAKALADTPSITTVNKQADTSKASSTPSPDNDEL